MRSRFARLGFEVAAGADRLVNVVFNVLVILCLGTALVIQIIALAIARHREIEIDGDGTPYLTFPDKGESDPRRTAQILTIVSLIVATVGGFLSLWAPGFV